VSQASCRTPLTYYGGKPRLAGRIVALMPPHRVYLEPFAGGAAVLFQTPRAARETLNDLDSQVMRFWRALRDYPNELAAAIATTPYSRDEWTLCRAQPDADDDVEAARRFLVWIDQSFSREGIGWSHHRSGLTDAAAGKPASGPTCPTSSQPQPIGSPASRSSTPTRST
jgi:DNA adenine methylase